MQLGARDKQSLITNGSGVSLRQKTLCKARTRRGTSCQCKALPNGRCRLHGGLSSGPKTEEGKRRIADAQRERWRRQKAGSSIDRPKHSPG